MAKLKINMAGGVFDVTKYELVTELLMQRRFDAWLGKDTVKVKLNKLSDNEVEVTIFRKYGTFYEPENHRTKWPDHQNIFSFDRQFLLGINYQIGTVADLSKHEGHNIWTYDVEDFFDEYKKQAKELKASRPKEMFFEEDWDYMKLILKY